jgi:hypothetical protein
MFRDLPQVIPVHRVLGRGFGCGNVFDIGFPPAERAPKFKDLSGPSFAVVR